MTRRRSRRRDWQPGHTSRSGLGWPHQKARKAALARLRDGDPCPRCGQPMYRAQRLDLDHVIPRVLGGGQGPKVLSHAACNRSHGARITTRIRAAKRAYTRW